jgi:site-specific DNA-cytosine methylase
MAERPLYTLYKNLKAQNYDVPNDYNKFESALTRDGKGGADNRHAIYENLKAQNFDVPNTYERFYSALFEPRSKTSSRAKGGSVPMSAADRARFSAGAAAISASANNAVRQAKRNIQSKLGQAKKFNGGRVTPHLKNPLQNKNVQKNEFNYNSTTGKTGTYTTTDGVEFDNEYDAAQYQNQLDKQGQQYINAVNAGEIPSVFDVRDKNGNYDLQENINKNGTYLTEEGARNQFDKKLADAYARKKEIEALIAEDHRQHGNPLLSYGASIGASNGRTAEQSDYSNKLATSLALVKQQIGALEAVKQYPTSSWGEDALKALDNTAFTAKTWDFGLTDFATMGQMERIKTKMDNNLPLSGSDKMLLKSKLGADAAAALEDEKMGNIYRWTKIAGQSLPFMADFFLTGGYGGITKTISRGALKFAAKRGMGKVSAAILKNTGIVAGDVIGSYAMAGSEQAMKTGADIMQRHLGSLYQDEKGDYKFGTFDENGNLLHEGGESMGTALYKGLTSAMVENYTEKLFGHSYGIKKGAINFMEKHGMNASAEFFKNIGKSGWYTNSKKWMEKFGINGFGEEVMEEEIGIPLHALLDGDNEFSDLLDTKQQLDIIGGMALSVGSMYAMGAGSRPVKGVYNRAQYYRFRNKVNVADSDAQNLMGDKWADIKDKIDNTTNEQMGGVLADILRQRDTMNKDQINAAINYGINLMKMRGYNVAKTAEMNAREITNEPTTPEEQHQEDIDNAYSEGHDADDAAKHDIQLEHEDQMKTLAGLLNISEQQLSAMNDDELQSLTGQNDKLDQAIYDYQLSSARYQGVTDDAQDKIDMAANQAAQRVDMYTDKSRGSVRNATVKASGGAEDYGVYIISGNIATNEDGSINVADSDDMILFYDPTTNSVEHADALRFAKLGDEVPADDVKAQAVADAKEKAIKEVAGIVDGTIDVGSQFSVTDADGLEHTYEILADYGDGTAAISIDGNVVENPYQLEDLQQLKDLEDQKRLETAKAQREQMEKERAEQQTQETEQLEETQPSLDFNQILNDNGNVVLVDVLDKDGNTKYPDSKLFLIRDTGAKAKVVEMKSDGTFVPHAVSKKNVATISSMSLDEYKQAMAESSMIEENSGENRGEIEVETPAIEGETAAPAEEAAAPESAETPATEQTPAMTLEDGTIVPMLEDGNPDFSKLTADQTAELYDSQFGEDADSVISGWVSDAKKALDKANNMTVKGKNFVEQKAAKEAKEKAIADAQAAYDSAIAIRDAYNSRQLAKVEDTAEGRKELIEKARRKFARLKSAVKDDAEAVSQLYKDVVGSLLHRLYDGTGIDVTDTIPLTGEEYVASNLGAHSLNYEGTETSKGVKQETGLSREDFAKTQLLAADGKGTTIDDLVHSLWENRPSNLESLDTQDIRNALIGVLTSGFKASEARNYIENLRIAQAENILEEQKKAADNAVFAEEQKAPAEEQTETTPESEEKTEENNSDEINDEENEQTNAPEQNKFPDKLREGSKAIEVPEDATDENPLGAQRDQTDLPFSARDNGAQQTTSERAADVEKNKVDDMKVVDNIVGEKTRKAFERLAKMMGANIQWQYSDKLGNGWIQETTDADGNVHRTIFITLDSSITEGAQFIFGHEMTHQIKRLNPAAYNELTQLVLDTYGSDAFDKAIDETMKRYSDAGFSGRARDYYAEEVVADAVGEMIRDLNLAHTLAMKMSYPLLAAIHEILQKIKLAFFGTEYSDVTKNIIRSIEQAYVKTANGEVTNSETGEDVSFSLRQKPEPKKKGVGYKVFVLKDGKLYPPMVANPDGAATPVGVWLDADAAPIAGESKTGRPQVKQGGKGTQGGSGKLAYRPGWHLGVVPYAIQFNRKDAEGNKTLFPKNFVFAEVEYAADVDYQEEARQEGINPSGKYQHSLAGLKHLPTDGYYMYRTNPNPETDPWVITGAMKVNRILTRAEQADLVSKAGREPQQIQEGDIVTDDVVNSINQEIAAAPKFSLKVYHGSGADFTEFDFDHMGEGAGSQAFGWGGYVTTSKKIGKSYAEVGQQSVQSRHSYSEDTPIEAAVSAILGQDMYNKQAKTFEQKKAQAIKNAENSIISFSDMLKSSNELDEKGKKFLQKSIEEDKKKLEVLRTLTEEQYKEEYIKQGRAKNLYEVDIPEDNGSNYLDWDAPITDELIDKVAKALPSLRSYDIKDFKKDRTFDNFYKTISMRSVKDDAAFNDDKAASKLLASLGYTGIKYKAGRNFGGAEEGDTNYVIFKPEDMKITEHTKFSLKEIKPVGKNKFGDVYDQFKGKPKEAFDFLLENKDGYLKGVFHRDEIGDIDLGYGEAPTPYTGYGLAHIIRKHVELMNDFDSVDDAVNAIIDVILNGKVEPINKDRVYEINKDIYRVAIAKDENGNWVLSAMDKSRSKKQKLRDKSKKGAATVVPPSLPSDGAGAVAPNLSAAKIDNSFETAKENGEKFSLKDEEYLKAVEDGDMEKAQKMVNEAAEAAGYSTDSSYQGTSAFNGSAPWGNGYFLTKEERKEAWDNDEYDGDQTLGDYIHRGIDAMNLDFIALDPRNYRAADPMRKEAIDNVRNAIQKKSETITMYRSVPSDVKEGSFRNGDWVTPSRAYAVDNAKVHGWGDNFNIIEQKVPVDEIWWDGNDIAEWGYGREEDYVNDTDFAYKNTKNNRKLLDAVTYDDNGNVIPLSQRFNENNADVRYSLKDEKTMFGMHNISLDKLRKAIKQGGFAAPSMGVIDSKNGIYSGYGEITLIPKAEKIAKRTGKNIGTYAADAWTPIYPPVEKKFGGNGGDVAYDDIESVPKEMQSLTRNAINSFMDGRDTNSLAYLYLHEKGKAPELVHVEGKYPKELHDEVKGILGKLNGIYNTTDEQKEKLLDLFIREVYDGNKEEFDNDIKKFIKKDEEFIKKRPNSNISKDKQLDVDWMKEHGYDYGALSRFVDGILRDAETSGKVDENATMKAAQQYIQDKGMKEDFDSWKEKLNDRYQVEEVIFAGYKDDGNRKYLPNTVENAVKVMKQDGKNASVGSASFSHFVASILKPMGTLDQIRKKKGNLTGNYEDVEKFQEKWQPVYDELADKMQPDAEPFESYGMDRLEDAATQKNPKKYAKDEYGVDLTDEDIDKLNELIDAVKNEKPSIYFETKFMRPYGLDEFEKAIVPNDTPSDVVDALKMAGIDVSSYERGNAEDRQKVTMDAINSSDNIRFSLKSMMEKPEGWKQANKKTIHIAEAIERDPKFSLKNLDGTLIKAGTYFSGGGLVEEGLKGIIDPVVAVEYDEKISGVYRNNFGQHIVTADVRDVDPKELVKQIDGELEYFHASPVCKNYSQAKSNHAEVELDKETAASTAEFINAIKPKVVTIENVKGYKDSDAMKIITDALDANGYTWDADVYNAADYGGYTNRERLIVRAVRDGKLPEKPKKMARKSGWYEAVADIIPTLTEKKNGVAPWMDIRLKADGIDWRNIDKPLYVMGSAYADGKIPHAFADELLPTLRTKSGDVIVMPDGKVYRAMGRVLARVSGVSDDYKMPFSESLSHTIIGNGIPTQLTEHVIAPLLQNTLRPTAPEDGNTKFSLRYDKFEHDLNQWKKDNNLPKDAQRPTIPQRNAGESAVDFLRRVDEYRKQMALWKTAPTYEQHLLSDDTALGEFNRELQRGSVLKRIAFQDSMLAIRKAQEAIMNEVGVDRLNMAEDAYTAENRSHGKGKNEFEEYNNEFLQPLRKAYHQMKKVLGDSYDNVRVYMMAKHGLERDAQMAFKKSLEADYEDVNQRSAAYKAYKNDLDRVSNDADLEFGRVDFTTWRQKDNALRGKYSPSYMDYRYDDNGIAYDYSGLSSLFDGSDFEEAAHRLVRDVETKHLAEVQALWNATDAATKKILRDGFKAGMMSKDAYEYVKGMYSHYIPLRGWDGTTADQVWDYIGGGKGAFNQTLKTAHGRTSIADDPIAYIENMAESGILLNNKNWVKQHLMLLAQNHPTSLLTLNKAWYVKSTDANGNEEWIPATPHITSQMNSNQVKAAIDAFEQKMENMAQTGDATQQRDGLNIAYPQTHSEEREHEVRVMKDGEEYVIYVNGDPQLAQAMNNTRAHRVREIQSGKLDRAAAWLGRKMAAAYTSLSPLFIPSNYFRDLTMTLASTAIREDGRYNYLLRKNLATSWNLGFMLKDYQNGKLREKVSNGNATKKEQMFYDFMMNGGETGFVSSLDVEDLKKKFKNDLKDLDRWKANPVKVGHTIMDGIEFLNRMIEDSNRFAVYMTSIQYGRSIDEAVNDAKDVTLNFNRKGTGEYGWQMIRNLYLFINPAVQSLQTLGALVKHHPFKFTAVTAAWLASGVLVLIVNAALMSLLGGDDDKDKYWQFSKWDRRNNAIMWIPFTNEYVKIPLAQEFRAFYGIGDMIASKMMGGELAEETWSQYAEDLLGQVVDMLPLDPTGYDGNIAVSLMPNPIRPVFELAFNVDFTGKPLFKETEYNKYDPNFTKAYVGTPDWLVRVSKMVNSIGNDYSDVQQNAIDAFGDPRYNLNNPAVVDHVLSSYLGGAYTMGSQVLGVLTKSLNDPKEIKMADIPLVSKFVSNPDDRPVTKKQGDEFWDMKENHDRTANTLSKLKKQAKVDGDYSMLERFYGSEEYKQYKQEDVKVKKYEEDKKKERVEESGEEYRPHKLNAEDIYKAHATPKDDFEDLKLKQLYTKLNGFKTSYDLLVDTAPSQSDGYYNTNKVAIDAIDEISIDKQEISELKKGFLEDGKDAYNAEDMKRIRELRKRILSVLEPANKVVVANQKAKAEKK